MVIKILLIISIILQLGAATVAIGMIRKTKYNLSWMLFTVALTGLAGLRFGEYVQITHMKELHVPQEFFVWLGIIVSLCFAVGILIVNKLLNYIARTESQRHISERRLLNTVLRTVCGWTFPLFQYTEQELTYSCTFPRSISDSCRW